MILILFVYMYDTYTILYLYLYLDGLINQETELGGTIQYQGYVFTMYLPRR